MDIHIEIGRVLLFLSIVGIGSAISWYWYRRGVQHGWDDSMYQLCESGYIDIDEETLEIKRVSDHQYKQYQKSYQEN